MASNGGTPVPTRVQIEGIQTVVSMKPTEPPLAQRVVLNQPEGVKGVVFKQCHQILLYYRKANPEDSTWVMIGRLKESLGRALLKYPMFTGRVKWEEKDLVLVSNDSGMRLVEAKYPTSMDEFLGMVGREEAESELVYWEDLKEHDPQFCPLSYIQVTEFECGGYSIGLSLSVLLGDSLELSEFLKHLSTTHLDIFFKNKRPAFYLPKHKVVKLIPIPSNIGRRRHSGQTLIYHINAKSLDEQDDTVPSRLASLCVADAEQKLGVSSDLEFTFFAKDGKTSCSTVNKGMPKGLTSPSAKVQPNVNGVKWDEAIFYEATFWEEHKPIHGAYWIGLHEQEGLVMVNMSRHDDNTIDITVSIP